jgi:4-hydroxybenzoate polyprenyltransferase
MDLDERNAGLVGRARADLRLPVAADALRLHQWVKNGLILVPLVLGGKATDAVAWADAAIGFLGLGLVASAAYIVNDLHDLPHDRLHPSKRNRPLARGALSIRAAIALAAAAFVAGLALGVWAGADCAVLFLIYAALSLSYSFYWKRVPLLDSLLLAGLFTLRLVIGIVVARVRLSEWLLIFSMFLFFSLSMAKRHTEILTLAAGGTTEVPGRGYRSVDAPLVLALGVGCAVSSTLVLILYLIEDAYPRDFYAHPDFLWPLPALLLLFLGRAWLLGARGELHEDPVIFALKDRVSLLLAFLGAIVLAAALFGIGLP